MSPRSITKGLLFLLLLFCSVSSPAQSSGRLHTISRFSSTYVDARRIDVWLPAGYDSLSSKRYDVLYMHDGQNLFSRETAFGGEEWGVDEAVTRLTAGGKMRDCIVVGIWNTPKRFMEYAPAKPYHLLPAAKKTALKQERLADTVLSDNYVLFLTRELKPFIDQTFKTKPGQKNTFIMGSSMGGLISLYAALERPDVFGGAGCLSTHWPMSLKENDTEFVQAFIRYFEQKYPGKEKPRLYFDYGTTTLDAWYEPHQKAMDEFLTRKKYGKKRWVSRKFEGAAHNEKAWRERLDFPLLFLLGK